MTRKDYGLLAKAFRLATMRIDLSAAGAADFCNGIAEAREQVARQLAADNYRFDVGRFIEACRTGEVTR